MQAEVSADGSWWWPVRAWVPGARLGCWGRFGLGWCSGVLLGLGWWPGFSGCGLRVRGGGVAVGVGVGSLGLVFGVWVSGRVRGVWNLHI